MSFSTQFGFPTENSVILFPFPELSFIVLSAIEIFTAPSYVPKFPNVNVYPVLAPSNSAISVIFVNVLVIVVIGLLGSLALSTYTNILSAVNVSFK